MDSAIESGLLRQRLALLAGRPVYTPNPTGRIVFIMPSQYSSNQELSAASNINWVTTFFMVAFHIGAVAALFFFSWKVLFVAIFLWWVSGSLGIGMGYHRLLTHRGYKTRR